MKVSVFDRAVLKLTGWYVLMILLVSVSTSVVFYQFASAELGRMARPTRMEGRFLNNAQWRLEREERATIGRRSIGLSLVLLNVTVAIVGGGLSYLLARQTLKPIAQAHEAQGRFVSDAAHELRSPLTVMKTEAEVALRDKTATKDDLRLALESSVEEIDRLNQLTERLLTLTADQELPKSEERLHTIAKDAVVRVKGRAKSAKIKLVDETIDLVVVTNSQVATDILVTLLDNAIKYSPSGSTVTLSTVENGRRVGIRVSDEGVGVAAADRHKIFDRFYRADTSRSRRNVSGFGLGLSIAKHLADGLGARIEVGDNKPKGSVFTVWL